MVREPREPAGAGPRGRRITITILITIIRSGQGSSLAPGIIDNGHHYAVLVQYLFCISLAWEIGSSDPCQMAWKADGSKTSSSMELENPGAMQGLYGV